MNNAKKIIITVGLLQADAELNDTETAEMIYNSLPIKSCGNFWGDEIYFSIPVDTDQENPQQTVEKGDLAYWPTGSAMCIFYGKTPASVGDEIRPASSVTVVGKILGEPEVFKKAVLSNPILVERADS